MTVAVAVAPEGFWRVYVNVVVPEKSRSGTNTMWPSSILTEPCSGSVTDTIVNGSPSGSVSLSSTGIETLLSSSTSARSGTASGGKSSSG